MSIQSMSGASDEPALSVAEIGINLLQSLYRCLYKMACYDGFYSGALPSGSNVLERIAHWPDAQATRDFVESYIQNSNLDNAYLDALANQLQLLADQGNTAARAGLDKLLAARARKNDPDRWVEVVVHDSLVSAGVEFITTCRIAQAQWSEESDSASPNKVVPPLICWDMGPTGKNPTDMLGRVCEQDEPAMLARLQDLHNLEKRRGQVDATSPMAMRPDGRYSFFALLAPTEVG